MKYILAMVGKLKRPFNLLYEEYKKRLAIEEKIFDTQQKLKQFLQNKQYFVLDEKGILFSSQEFADFIKEQQQKILFVIGDENGLDQSIKNKAKNLISLSRMTFPHDLAKIILLEQIYRAETILKNKPYHK